MLWYIYIYIHIRHWNARNRLFLCFSFLEAILKKISEHSRTCQEWASITAGNARAMCLHAMTLASRAGGARRDDMTINIPSIDSHLSSIENRSGLKMLKCKNVRARDFTIMTYLILGGTLGVSCFDPCSNWVSQYGSQTIQNHNVQSHIVWLVGTIYFRKVLVLVLTEPLNGSVFSFLVQELEDDWSQTVHLSSTARRRGKHHSKHCRAEPTGLLKWLCRIGSGQACI